MIKYVSGCVGCGFPCMGSRCPYHTEVELYCDKCKDQLDEIFEYYTKQLCFDCLKEETRINNDES